MAICKYCLSNHKIALIKFTPDSPFRPITLTIWNARLYVRDCEHDVVATTIAELKLQSEEQAKEIMQYFGLVWLTAPDFSTALHNLKSDFEAELKLFVSEYYEKEGLL